MASGKNPEEKTRRNINTVAEVNGVTDKVF